MIEPILVVALPLMFAVVMAAGMASLRRRKIDMEGRAPIGKTVFLLSKLVMVVPWAAMVLRAPAPGSPTTRLRIHYASAAPAPDEGEEEA